MRWSLFGLALALGACGADGSTGEEVESDKDGDGIADTEDVCPSVADPSQADLDGDGLGDACDPDVDGDLVSPPADCDDLDPDRDVARTVYADADGDGLGDPATPIQACDDPEGYVENAEDPEPACATNDTDECGVCGGPGTTRWWPDSDGDGLGDPRSPIDACHSPPGFVDNGDDPEPECADDDVDTCGVCGGGNAAMDCLGVCFGDARLDECGECNGPGLQPVYTDVDGDGLGDPASVRLACAAEPAEVDNGDDPEPLCATNDEDACGVCAGPGPATAWADGDGDGLGDPAVSIETCGETPGFVANADDTEPSCATNDTDDCGVCGGENETMDCLGVCDGEAYVDACERCVGGSSTLEPFTEDGDRDGVPNACDACADDESARLIVQWTDIAPFRGEGGPYTFQVTLFSNGDFSYQYLETEPFEATLTVGHQGAGGADAVELGFNSEYVRDHRHVYFDRREGLVAEVEYTRPMEWVDIRMTGTALELADDGSEEVEIGFDFPFGAEGDTYDAVTVGSNGFVAFSAPLPGYGNGHLPAAGLGAFLAPFWDDLNPVRAGAIHVQQVASGCAADCDGMLGGVAVIDECGACVGGSTGSDGSEARDCAGVCRGEAFVDTCGVCVGGDTGLEPSVPEDCPHGPDLVVDADYLQRTVSLDYVDIAEGSCLIAERCVQGAGTRRVIRFGTQIANIGNEDLVLGRPGDAVDHEPGDGHDDHESPWHWDDCHGHWHYEAYARYDIRDLESGEVLPIGAKNGFCVMDIGVYDASIAEDGCYGYNCGEQGITAGCQDTYSSSLQCQWIDVTDVADGDYELIVTTNPDSEIDELDYENNTATVRVRLTADAVEVLEDP